MANDVSSFGVITEQGDLGLGFNPTTKEEKAVVENTTKANESRKEEKSE